MLCTAATLSDTVFFLGSAFGALRTAARRECEGLQFSIKRPALVGAPADGGARISVGFLAYFADIYGIFCVVMGFRAPSARDEHQDQA